MLFIGELTKITKMKPLQQYQEDTLKKFDENIEEMVKQTTYGLICEECGGGGMSGDNTCTKCGGHGIHTWRTNHLSEKIKDFLKSSLKGQLEVAGEEIEDIPLDEYTYGGFRRKVLDLLSADNTTEK